MVFLRMLCSSLAITAALAVTGCQQQRPGQNGQAPKDTTMRSDTMMRTDTMPSDTGMKKDTMPHLPDTPAVQGKRQ